jgi:outer membrane protein assembly factor BamB
MKTVSTVLMLAIAVLLARPSVLAQDAGSANNGSDKVPLGSPDFYPSAEHPIGWRGDGTGCYPGATPPTVWFQKANGQSRNIFWKTRLPCYSWSTPIVVGDKIFTRSEPYDLLCLNKNTGKLLWIRSCPPFIGVSEEEKKANPAFQDVEPLVTELQKVNDDFVSEGWSKDLYQKKHDLQIKIDELTAKADKKYKLPRDQYVESWCGYTGATPCSDGRSIFITSGGGITACFDLSGNRKWARFESVAAAWGEHGSGFTAPIVIGDRLISATTKLCALDKDTGKQLFTFPGKGQSNGSYGMLPIKINGADYLVAFGNIYRVSDGTSVFNENLQTLFTVHDNVIYFLMNGYIRYYRWEPQQNGGLVVKPLIAEEYGQVALPTSENPTYKVGETINGFYTASPLCHDGLLYCVGNSGRLVVMDTNKTRKSDVIVYNSFPPFDFKNGFGRKTPGMGLCASPASAGKYIYMIDSANCTLVMEPGREYKQVAKNIIEETVPEQQPNAFGEKSYSTAQQQEQTESGLIFDGNRLYIRGEQNLYCISEETSKN